MSKALLCPCEDVTTSEIEHAISKGSCDLESVKRFTGFGTGMCQGKQCLTAVARFLEEKTALKGPQLMPFTPRPPLFPTELSHWASAAFDPAVAPAGGVPPSLGLTEPALKPEGPVPERAKIVVIGGGIMGLALAWNLAERGERDVVVLERGYLCAGASGRNGGGVRMQWGTPTLIQLARRSIELMGQFARLPLPRQVRRGRAQARALRAAPQQTRRSHADPHPRRRARRGPPVDDGRGEGRRLEPA
jgi:sarcosine oxidase subunit beta